MRELHITEWQYENEMSPAMCQRVLFAMLVESMTAEQQSMAAQRRNGAAPSRPGTTKIVGDSKEARERMLAMAPLAETGKS